MTEPCSCNARGWCPRHRIQKTGYLFTLCQTREDYRALWDRQAPAREFCRDWKDLGGGVFTCPHCGKNALAPSIDDIQTRACHKPPSNMPAPAISLSGGCGGCGGSPVTPSIVAAPELTLAEKAGSFASAMLDFISDPRFADSQARLAICESNKCRQRDGHTCTCCGCYLPIKVRGAAWHCPLGLWPGDEKDWTPNVHEELLAATCALIPAHDVTSELKDMTTRCLGECRRELRCAGLVVDEGCGWGEKCNRAIERALCDPALKYIVLLNNDTRLSPNFFAGLIVAQRATQAAAVAASYNVGWAPQQTRDKYDGPADQYQPKPFHKWTGICDGTAVLMTTEAIRKVGLFDLSISPKYNWNLVADWCIRAKKLGYRIAITEAAYVYHLSMQTAQQVYGSVESYVQGAIEEATEGMRRKWGENVQQLSDAIELPRDFKKRNLIYHVAPFKRSDAWKRNLEQLAKRSEVFTGKKIITVATGDEMDRPQDVRWMMGDLFGNGWMSDCRLIEIPNSRVLRENVNVRAMLKEIESTDPSEITFFGHSKGTATAASAKGVTRWRNAMYHHLLDDMPAVELALSHRPIVGTHRRDSPGNFDDGTPGGGWHFAGTFFWFRNADVFTRDWNGALSETGWGMEAWPGRLFKREEGHCIAFDGCTDPYNPASYHEPIDDDEVAESGAIKIELGNGHTPRGDGFITFDNSGLARQIDFDAEDFSLPFEDGTVQRVYCPHLINRVRNPRRLLCEICRVGAIGALVEIVLPHWASDLLMVRFQNGFGAEIVSPEIAPPSLNGFWHGGGKRLAAIGIRCETSGEIRYDFHVQVNQT